MASNIKIVGNILSTTQVSRYSDEDINLMSSKNIQENFGGKDDYIEYYVYDAGNNLLNISYNYLNYKLPSSLGLTPSVSTSPNTTGNIQTTNIGIDSTLATPTSSLYPIIEIDPIQDLQDLGYSSGEFKVRYNLFQKKISNFSDSALFVKEISSDRTEIRLASTTLSDNEIESITLSMINEMNISSYYIDYLLNFGNNEQYIAVNIALNKEPSGYEVLFKLYQPLPLSVQEKTKLWVVEEKVNPYDFDINLDKLILPPPPPTLRSPNFDIEIPNQGTISTTYQTYSNLVTNLQSLQQNSYHQILNLLATQSVNINVDYTDFDNFVFFGSAYQRLSNFYDKVKEIEGYNNFITTYTPFVATTASLQLTINQLSASINDVISKFDGYERYMYFESSSYSWPKTTTTKPFVLQSTGSATVITWYNNLITSTQEYDLNNYNNLEYAIPTFIKNDENNQPFLIFLNMVGHYFDNVWIYLKAITDINVANNNLNVGISKDLVYERLKSLGLHLYNSQAGEDVSQYLVGANTGSATWDNDTTITGSYLNNIPRKDLVAELYKRIYHNLPLLLKQKGTKIGLQNLITTFGLYTGVDGILITGPNGNQIWSNTNYQGTTYKNGDPILEAQSDTDWVAANTAQKGAWCYYSGSYDYANYGKLYNWYALNDSRGFGPEGWHIPSLTEWRILTSSLSASGATTTPSMSHALRALGSDYWSNNSSATNTSELSLVGNGTRAATPGTTTTWTNSNQPLRSAAGYWATTTGRFVLSNTNISAIGTGINAGTGQAVRFVKDTTDIFNDTDNLINVKEFGGSLKSNLIKGYNNDKVRIVSNTITGSVLSPFLSLQTFSTASNEFRENDDHYVDISFTPQAQINTYISKSIASNNATWSLDDYIGDPRQLYSTSYSDLDTQRKLYYQTGVSGYAPFTASLLDYNKFIRLVEYFDNSLFKMLEDFVPERTSLSTGITFESPVLERNKVVYANPTATTTSSVNTAAYTASSGISTQYGTFYNALSSSNNTMGWFDGELSGSNVNIHQYFEDNYNPYLSFPSGTIDQNFFQHSDWNVLLNNVSSSVQSLYRRKIEYLGDLTPTQSITYPARLQDSYLTLRSYNISRYEGSKLTSKLYNTYTSASYTGSDGFTIQNGDMSYGKTAAVDRQSYKVGWVKNIPSQSLNFFDKTQIQLKYLVDKDINVLDLNSKNNNLFEVQNTFKSGDPVVVSLSDTTKPSFQRLLDGTKTIFRGGYTFDPIIFREQSENLNFKLVPTTPILIGYSGIKGINTNFYEYYAGNIFRDLNVQAKTPITSPGGSYGYSWYINDQSQESSMADAAYVWNTTSGPDNFKYAQNGQGYYDSSNALSTVNNNAINLWKPSSAFFNNSGGIGVNAISQNPTRQGAIYLFDFLSKDFDKFSTGSGYYTEITDVTANGNVLYKAPRTSTYTIKATIPFTIGIIPHVYSAGVVTAIGGGANTTTTDYSSSYYNFKVVGILEKSSDNGSTWNYVGNTRFDQTYYYTSREGAADTVIDYDFNCIHGKSTKSRQNVYGRSTQIVLKLRENFSSPTTANSDPTNQIVANLNTNDILRFFICIYDLDNGYVFRYSDQVGFKIGAKTNISTLAPILPETSFEIYDTAIPRFGYDVPISVTSSQMFSINNPPNSIEFIGDFVTLFNTQSLFIPSSKTSNYYSPVIDFFSIQPNDLMRIGSIENTISNTTQYYNIINTELVVPSSYSLPLTTKVGYVSNFDWSTLPGFGSINGLTFSENYSTIIVPDPLQILSGNYISAYTFFYNLANSNTKTFTDGANSTFTILDSRHVTLSSNGFYLYIAVSNNINLNFPPTIFSNFGATDTSSPDYTYDSNTSQNRTFTPIAGTVYNVNNSNNKVLKVTLDRPIHDGGSDRNFAIFRPKPDETSVIINYKKQPGDTSQAIIIPQDASDELKGSIGKIYQKLNTDLSSNQTTTG